MKKLLALLLIVSPLISYADASWYNSSWGYRKAITIDHTKVASSTSETYTNFPVLVDVGLDTNLKTTSQGGHVAQDDYGDILFTASDGTTKLFHEVPEYYSSTTGKLISWVNLGTNLSTSTDTVIYMYYGNATCDNQWTSVPRNVWNSNYAGVWHMNDNVASTTIVDSLGLHNAINVSNTNTKTTTGKIDGALNYNGTTDGSGTGSIDLSNTNKLTVSYWSNWTHYANDDDLLMEFSQNYNGQIGGFIMDPNAASGNYVIALVGNVGYVVAHWAARPDGGVSHAYSITFDKGLSSHEISNIYVDGVAQSLTWASDANNTNNFGNFPLYFMSRGASSLNGAGTLDEVRISTTTLSSDWIKTEYNNQSSTSTFYSIGSETSGTTTPNILQFISDFIWFE